MMFQPQLFGSLYLYELVLGKQLDTSKPCLETICGVSNFAHLGPSLGMVVSLNLSEV